MLMHNMKFALQLLPKFSRSLIMSVFTLLTILFIISPGRMVLAQTIGTSYYVSKSGSDSNPGTLNSPWKTLPYAIQKIKAGDTLFIHGGTYQEYFAVTNSGTQSSPITITNYNGEEVILDGINNTLPSKNSGTPMIGVYGDWVTIKNMTIRYAGTFAVYTIGSNVTLENLYVHHNWGGGIILSGEHDVLQNSRIWYNSTMNENGQSSSGWGTGASCARYPEYCAIRNNTVWQNWGEGVSSFEANASTIEANIVHDNWSANVYISDLTNVVLQRNFIYASGIMSGGSQVGIMMGDEKYTPASAYIKIINNIVYGTHRNFAWWQGTQGGGMNNVLIAYNTFVNGTGSSSGGEGGVIIGPGDHYNVRFYNNLVQQDGDLPVIATIVQSGITYYHNLWSKPPYAAASGVGDVIADPKFIKIGTPFSPEWFLLSNLSPAIDKAVYLTEANYDYFLDFRGGLPDIGADEAVPLILTEKIFLPMLKK